MIDQTQKRALARAAHSHDDEDFAAIDGKIEPAQDFSGCVRFPDIAAYHERRRTPVAGTINIEAVFRRSHSDQLRQRCRGGVLKTNSSRVERGWSRGAASEH